MLVFGGLSLKHLPDNTIEVRSEGTQHLSLRDRNELMNWLRNLPAFELGMQSNAHPDGAVLRGHQGAIMNNAPNLPGNLQAAVMNINGAPVVDWDEVANHRANQAEEERLPY